MTFRFLHTADWQIGKPFGNIPGDAGAELRSQRVRTVEKLAQIATERTLDAVLVAGDVFDSNEVEERTIDRLLNAMRGFSGPWLLLPGNHDAALSHSVWTRLRQRAPTPNIVIADKPEPIALWGNRAVVFPAPLRRRRESHDQTKWFDTAGAPEGAVRVGLAHGTLPGRLPPGAEAGNPIAEDRVQTARLDYLALGDWHGARKVADRTWYSGTPETDRHRDNDSGHALIVELDAPGSKERVKSIATGAFAWHRLVVEVVDGQADAVLHTLQHLPSEPARSVVALQVAGSISLAERHRLDTLLADWQARLHHLDADLTRLIEDPTDEDLDSLDGSGFVRLAVDRLKTMAEDDSNPSAGAARIALRMLYIDHMRAGGA